MTPPPAGSLPGERTLGGSGHVPSLVVPSPPPTHVLAAFGAGGLPAQPLPGSTGRAFRFGDLVLRPVDDTAQASWSAAAFDQLRITGVRVPRPIRSSDGRWVVAGWSAQRFVSGRPEPRYDEIIEVSLTLHRALAGLPQPRFLLDRTSLYSWADRLAWDEPDDGRYVLGDGHGARLLRELADDRVAVDLPQQVVHGDLFGNVLFAGSAPPAVVGITPYWRPPEWAAGVIAVDALTWGGASTELLENWRHLPHWPQMVLRALIFRLAVSLHHPRSTPSSLVQMLAAADVIRPILS